MKRATAGKLCLVLLLIAGLVWAIKGLGLDASQMTPERVQELTRHCGVWAPVIYLFAYGQPLVPLPASLMTALAGVAFGKGWGLLAAVAGATTRACTEFLVARLLGRETVARLLTGRVAILDQKLGERSFQAVLLIRIVPNVPFDIQNYALGFSQVRFWPYALGTLLGIIPGSFAYVYLGYSLTDPKQIWKLGAAILLIISLMVVTSSWKRRRASYQTTSTTVG